MDFTPLEEQFESLAMKFLFVCEDGTELNTLLSELNGLDFKNQQITNSRSIVQFVESLTRIPLTSDPNVIAKTCQLIKQLINKQKIVLPENISAKVLQWILKCCQTKSIDLFYCEAVDALSVLYKGNPSAVQQHASSLLACNGFLLKFINRSLSNSPHKSLSVDSTPQELFKSSLSCIEAMLLHLSSPDADVYECNEEEFKAFFKTIVSFVFALKQEDNPENDYMTIITLSINCLKFAILIEPDLSTEFLGELIGISKSFMLFGIPEITQQPPTKIASSQQAIMEPASATTQRNASSSAKFRKGRKNNKKKPERNSEESHRSYGIPENTFNTFSSHPVYRTSDSDFSDNEQSRANANRYKQSKLRLAALGLLAAIHMTVDKKVMFGYWHSLFSTEESSSATLVNSIVRDTAPRCKILALQNIILMLKLSKPFMVQAENKDKVPATFTPFSVTLGNMIAFTYEKLTQALIKEGDLTVLAQILKCIAVFIIVTPFHRLRPGIVTNFFKYVRHLTRHKDPTVKVGALIVMGNLISISEITPEIYEILEIPKSKLEFSWKKIDDGLCGLNRDEEDEVVELEFEEEEPEAENDEETKPEAPKMSWLLQAALENLGMCGGVLKCPSPATSVRVESLQILSALSSHYLLLKDHQHVIAMALVNSFKSYPDEQLFACRALLNLTNSISIYLAQDNVHNRDLESAVEFWLYILPSVVEKIQDLSQLSAQRALLADSISNIGVHVFERLDHKKQMNLISILTGCSYDDDSGVKASAIRALAVFVMYPSLREDLCFIENTIESILKIVKDSNFLTRTKAVWSLGNVVDALFMIRETKSISGNLLRQVFTSSLEALRDHDRVKVNAVRATGILMTLLTKDQLVDAFWLKIFEDSINSLNNLLLNCNSVKLKWNICYSFASITRHELFFDPEVKFKWQDVVFPGLCEVIKSSPNFKVRINACTAFTSPSRDNFGVHFLKIWSCLLEALEQSNNMTDFSEYKHRDTLQDQICASMSHLIEIAKVEDVVQMKNEVFPLIDITKQNWNRVYNRWLPERQGKICSAAISLKKMKCKTSEQSNSVDILISCFQPVEQF